MKNELLKKLKSLDKSPEYYQYYPRLFYKYFESIDKKIVNDLSEAGYFYYLSILLTDNVVDNKIFSKLPLISLLQEEAVKILISIFHIDSEFWKYWDIRKQEFQDAIKIEKRLQIQTDVKFTTYQDLADKKSTFGKIAIDCLHILSNKKDNKIYKSLIKSHYYFSVGFQLYDDVKDFKEDFEKNQFNWAVFQLRKKIDFNQYNSDVNVLNKLLYTNGVAVNILNKSRLAFQKAMDIVTLLMIESEWLGIIEKMRNTISNYIEVTEGYVSIIKTKIKLYNKLVIKNNFFSLNPIVDNRLKAGLNYIEKDYLRNYAELKQVVYLEQKENRNITSNVHISDIFQRTLLNDCLLYTAKKQNLDISKYLHFEFKYLIKHENKDSIGGWSYFPSINGIAADIDNLGQIIQLFVNSNKVEFIDKYCLTSIHVALENKNNKDGSIALWIIPNEMAEQERKDLFNRTKWRIETDIEAIANFMYALIVYNPIKYEHIVERSMQYICEIQQENGFWKSHWYCNTYYSIYVCLRLLKVNEEKYSLTIRKALNFIIENQQENGGFGLKNEISDALSSASALLSLKMFFDDSNECIRRATNYLLSSQQEDGAWAEVNFIKPNELEPYKSRVLTTALVLKSLT
jgi:hypothetical protein